MKALSSLIYFLSITVSFSVTADITAVEKQLLGEVKLSNLRYQQQITTIAKERQQLLNTLAKAENNLKALSIENQLLTRAKDEKNITAEKLKARLKSWQQQQSYLDHLLADIDTTSPITSAEALSQRISKQANLNKFTPITVALKSGEMISGKKLAIGPANIFISDDNNTGGLINQIGLQWQLAMAYNDSQLGQLQKLVENKQGLLAFDTTNNRSILLSQNQESISDHLKKGGIWIIPILAFALMAFTIAIIKAISLLRLPALNLISPNNMGIHQQKLFDIAQKYQNQERDDLLFDQLMQTKRTIEKRLSTIAVTAAIAPLLGLLGTVSGMIQTFKLMTLFGAGDANAVSGGISESLVTTELGLIVAIPSLIAHAIMSRRCHHYMSGLESYAVKLSHLPTPPQPHVQGVSHVA